MLLMRRQENYCCRIRMYMEEMSHDPTHLKQHVWRAKNLKRLFFKNMLETFKHFLS